MKAEAIFTDDELHEQHIEAERLAMTEAYVVGDKTLASRHERVMAALIDLRSPEQRRIEGRGKE